MERLKMQMADPVFAEGEVRTARATLTVRPAGIPCTAEIWLSPDGLGKAASSGSIPFTSTGVAQTINLSVTMPAGGIEYLVLLDIMTDGTVLVAYQATDSVLIPWVSPPVIEW